MKSKIRAVFMFAIFVFICFMSDINIKADDSGIYGDFKYEVMEDGNVSIVKYIGNDTVVSIPAQISGKKVTKIGEWAFRSRSELISVSIPEGVREIDYWSFAGCIGMKSLIIPSSVTQIDLHAFSGCKNLESIKVNSKNKDYDSRKNCNALIETKSDRIILGCKNTIIPDDVKEIGGFLACDIKEIKIPNSVLVISQCAFAGCKKLTKVEFSNYLQEIKNEAFAGCSNLTSIKIPSGVTYIAESAFADCEKLNAFMVDKKNKNYDSRNNCNAIIETRTNKLIRGCKTTKIPNDVIQIGNLSFAYCRGLKRIEIPSSVTSIGNCSFAYCSELTTVEIPKNVTFIDEQAYFCSDKVIICGEIGSCAETFAKKYEIPFEKLCNHSKTAVKSMKKATTKDNGYSGDVYCTACKKVIKKGVIIYKPRKIDIGKTTYTYTGSQIKPSCVIKDSKGASISLSNYVITYKYNKLPGTATVTVVFKGSKYSGSLKKTFRIELPKVGNVGLKNTSKGKVSVTWKNTSKVTGYLVKYQMDNNVNIVKIAGSGKKNIILSKLTKGKTYKVSIRSYVTFGMKTYYGTWSTTKNVNVAK